jgi:raffinose/stachyose/melibiose transport system substrate-binding protein
MCCEKKIKQNKFSGIGLILAAAFYLASIIFVTNNSNSDFTGSTDVKTITFAHWNLEDGFREGFDEAIKEFEKLKAKEGIKVKVVQTTVPYRGYPQWFLTQLIGGSPADVLKYTGGSELLNQYFTPLSEYINKPNPFNKGTVMEGVPWKDTYIDGMAGTMDPVYSEHYGVGTYFHTYRIFVNMDLLKKATGSNKLPGDLSEWLEACKKLKEYGNKINKPIIPIGVRGFDKVTLDKLFSYYLAQMSGDFNDKYSKYCSPQASQADILATAEKDAGLRDRLLAAVDIVKELGQYFCEGFSTTDLEQTKFLFFAGMVGFFPEGTWNGYSMVNNSPFKVGIIPIPELGHKHKYSKYFIGGLSEQGVRVGGAFGIPKTTKHFDLALEFLQFVTSYKTNQMIMNRCKWPPAVREAQYTGLMEKFKPVSKGDQIAIRIPFYVRKKSKTKMLGSLENIIIRSSDSAKDDFWENFKTRANLLCDELQESLVGDQRNFLTQSMSYNRNNILLLDPDISESDKKRIRQRNEVAFENYIAQLRRCNDNERMIKELNNLDKDG